jgi:hypothetical protein
MAQRVIRVQHDPVNAVIATGQQLPVPPSEVIGHAPTVEPRRTSRQDISRTAPEGGGRLTGPLAYTSQGGIEETDFLILAALAFALSTDYGVFLLSRISEARRPGQKGRPGRNAPVSAASEGLDVDDQEDQRCSSWGQQPGG